MLVGAAAHAQAPRFDHLACWRVAVRGATPSDAVADLTPLDTARLAAEAGCAVRTKLRAGGRGTKRTHEMCAPVAKAVTQSGTPPLPVVGQDLASEFLCYKVVCPRTVIADLPVTDQFGARTLGRFKPKNQTLCVPLVRGAPPATTTTLPGGAALHDHLQCFPMRDLAKANATVELTPRDAAQFPAAAGCKVRGKGLQLCTPVDAAVRQSGAPVLPVVGLPLATEYVCYRLKCPRTTIAELDVAGPFGTLAAGRFQASRLCVPLTRPDAPTTTTTSTTTTSVTSTTAPNVPPTASDDAFGGVGNTVLAVGTAAAAPAVLVPGARVLANDADPDGGPAGLSVTAFDTVSTLGGSVAMGSDGTFVYTPPAGVTDTTDTFTYTAGDGADAATATVGIALSDLVWYVDAAAPPGGDGRSAARFTTLAEAAGAAGTCDTIFVFAAGTPYGGGIALQMGQRLIGQGAALVAGGHTLLAAGARPTIANTGGDAVVLGSDNTVRGLDVSASGGAGVAGTAVGNLTIGAVRVQAAGGAGVDVDDGTLAVTFDAVTVTGAPAHGVRLRNTGGTVTFGALAVTTSGGPGLLAVNAGSVTVNGVGNTIDATGGAAIHVSGTAVAMTFASLASTDSRGRGLALDAVGGSFRVTGPTTITNAAEHALRIAATSADVTLGDVTVADRNATGILIDGATGSTVRFGRVSVPNPNAAGGWGVRVEDTSAAVTFVRLDVSDTRQTVATADAGADGMPDNDGDGDGVFLADNTGSVTLAGGTIANVADDGVDVRRSANVNLIGVTIEDIGVASANPPSVHPAGVNARDLTGSNVILNGIIRRFEVPSAARGVNVLNDGTDLAELRVTNTTVSNPGVSPAGEDGLRVTVRGGTAAVVVENGTFTGLTGAGVHAVADLGAAALDLAVEQSDMNDIEREAVLVDLAIGAADVRVMGNRLGDDGAGGGVAVGRGGHEGIEIRAGGGATVELLVDGNRVRNAGADAGDETVDIAAEVDAVVDATVTSNVLANAGGAGAGSTFRAETAGADASLCLDLQGNDATSADAVQYVLVQTAGAFVVEGPGTAAVTDADVTGAQIAGAGSVVGTITFNDGADCASP
jgi:hypothetical protein